MNELFDTGKGLIHEVEWDNTIHALNLEKEITEPEDNIVSELRILVEDAVKARIDDDEHIGIFFSGGLDSSYIAALCKKFGAKFTCYTVGFQDGNMAEPEDIGYAKEVAKHLKLNDEQFKYKIFNNKEAEDVIFQTIKILKKQNLTRSTENINAAVNVGVASVVVAAYSISDKEKFFFTGLGSEEIFAGYERHKNNPTNNECHDGLLKMYRRDVLRDSAISDSLGFKFLTPFLDQKLIHYGLRIPIHFKINNDGSKMILRKAAMTMLGKYSDRPKKAAQYGSSFDKALLRIANNHGYKTRIEYINSI